MNQSELDALKALCAKATPEEWHNHDGEIHAEYEGRNGARQNQVVAQTIEPNPYIGNEGSVEDNAHFIAAARTALPRLIAEVEEARKVMKPFAEVDCDGLVDNLPPGSVWLYKANRTSQETKGISYADVLRARRFLAGKEGK